jgi:hypothetical protein
MDSGGRDEREADFRLSPGPYSITRNFPPNGYFLHLPVCGCEGHEEEKREKSS